MKKIIFIAFLLLSFFTKAQDVHFQGVETIYTHYMPVTQAERDALTFSANDRVILYNETTGTVQKWNGTAWEDLSGGGAGDNLGDHTATQDLDMADFSIGTAGFLDLVTDTDATSFAGIRLFDGTDELARFL